MNEVAGRNSRWSERRQLTVMFCDIVGSVGMSQRQDPEDLQEIIDRYHGACEAAVRAQGGQVVQYLGDGVMAQFGVPPRDEASARAAVRAGLAILRDLQALNRGFDAEFGETLSVRIGVHTGVAVVTCEDAERTPRVVAIVGDTPNIAARLQGLAQPGGIAVSAESRMGLGEAFEVAGVGEHEVKGVAEPIGVFEVLGERTATDRAWAQARGARAAFVGRAKESLELASTWREAAAGRGQIAVISGEAGLGKSRLCFEAFRLAGISEGAVYVLQCSPRHPNVALYPVIKHLEQRACIRDEFDVDTRRQVLRQFLGGIGVGDEQRVLTFFHLSGLSTIEELGRVEPDALRGAIREEAVELLLARGRSSACVCMVEDLHWADPSSLAALSHLIDKIRELPILLLLTTRHANIPSVIDRPGVVHITLSKLSKNDAVVLARGLLPEDASPALLDELVSRTDGVPLFVEEIASGYNQTGVLAADASAAGRTGNVPSVLYDTLIIKLDRAGPAKRAAQIAAAIGREFSLDLLTAVLREQEQGAATDVLGLIDTLSHAGVVQSVGTASYAFRHALVRDVAYESILKRERRALHGAIARTLQSQFGHICAADPDSLAQHLTEAGESEAAARQWLVAARHSIQRSANPEALAQITQALELTYRVENERRRSEMELDAQILLLAPTMAVNGYAAGATASARALDLCRTLENTRLMFPAIYGRWSFLQVTGAIAESEKLAREFVALATSSGNRQALMVGHRLSGSSLLAMGDIENARRSLRQALRFVYGTDPYVMTVAHLSIASWMGGHLDQAMHYGRLGMDRALKLAHGNTMGYAMSHICILHVLRRDAQTIRELAARFIAAAAEREQPFWSAVGSAFMGWCEAATGGIEQGITTLQRQLDVFRSARLVYWVPTYLCWLAEMQCRAGRFAEASRNVVEARSLMFSGGELWYEPETWRIEGKIDWEASQDHEAAWRKCATALKIARARGQTSLCIRAARDLARLAETSSERAEASLILADQLKALDASWREPDIEEARAILSALESNS